MSRRTIARKRWPTYLPSQLTPFKHGQGFNAFIKERCQQSFIAYLRFDLWGVLLVDQKKAKCCTTLISSANVVGEWKTQRWNITFLLSWNRKRICCCRKKSSSSSRWMKKANLTSLTDFKEEGDGRCLWFLYLSRVLCQGSFNSLPDNNIVKTGPTRTYQKTFECGWWWINWYLVRNAEGHYSDERMLTNCFIVQPILIVY